MVIFKASSTTLLQIDVTLTSGNNETPLAPMVETSREDTVPAEMFEANNVAVSNYICHI